MSRILVRIQTLYYSNCSEWRWVNSKHVLRNHNCWHWHWWVVCICQSRNDHGDNSSISREGYQIIFFFWGTPRPMLEHWSRYIILIPFSVLNAIPFFYIVHSIHKVTLNPLCNNTAQCAFILFLILSKVFVYLWIRTVH